VVCGLRPSVFKFVGATVAVGCCCVCGLECFNVVVLYFVVGGMSSSWF